MGLAEDLLEIVADNQQKREAERLSLKKLEADWGTVRDTVIRPCFELAARTLNEQTGAKAWEVKRDNGGIALVFRGMAHNISKSTIYGPTHELSFCKDEEEKKIACDCSEEDIKEDFNVSKVTEDEVGRKIKEFVRAVT